MVRKTKTEAARTRSVILDAAEAEMQVSGVSGASFQRIACRAKLTRGAIYWHFKDRDALLSAMVARTYLPLRDLQDSLHAELPEQPAGTILREMLLHGLNRLANDAHHRRVCHIVAHCCEGTGDGNPVADWMRTVFEDSWQVLKGLCRDAEASGQLQAHINADMACDMILAFMCGVYDCCLRYPDLYTAQRNWEPIVDALLDGIFAHTD